MHDVIHHRKLTRPVLTIISKSESHVHGVDFFFFLFILNFRGHKSKLEKVLTLLEVGDLLLGRCKTP